MSYTKSYKQSNKTSSARHEKPPFKLMVWGIEQTPQIIQVIVNALECLLKLESKTSPISEDSTHFRHKLGRVKLKLNWKSSLRTLS